MKDNRFLRCLLALIPLVAIVLLLSIQPKTLDELLHLPEGTYSVSAMYWPTGTGFRSVTWEADSPQAQQTVAWLRESSYHTNPLRLIFLRAGLLADYRLGIDESVILTIEDSQGNSYSVRLCSGEIRFTPPEGDRSGWLLPSHRGLRKDIIELITAPSL